MGRALLIIIVLGGIIVAIRSPGAAPAGAPSPATEQADGTFSRTSRGFESRDIGARANAPYASSVAPASGMASGQGMTLDRAPDGHFYADAQVNGVTVHFLIDTGASGVALSADDARRVGLPFYSSEFTAVGRGASGEVRGKILTLDRVSLGGKSVQNVSGAILEGSEMSLLGQSFLGQMGSIQISGDKMVIS